MASEPETLLGVFKDHTAIANTLWGIFQAVSLAFLGYVYTQAAVRENPWVLLGLSAMFVVFVAGNQAAIVRSQAILVVICKQFHDATFNQDTPGLSAVMTAHTALDVRAVRRGHVVFASAVIAGAWLPYLVSAIN